MLAKISLVFFAFFMVSVATSAQATDISIFKDSLDEFDQPVAQVAPGSQITYQLTIQDDQEGVDGSGVVVTDNVPAAMSIVSVETDAGTCAVNGQQVTCNLGTVADGATVTIFIVTTLSASAAIDDEISNTATVTASNEIEPVNNQSTSSFVVGIDTIPDPDTFSDGSCSLQVGKHRSQVWSSLRRTAIALRGLGGLSLP